MSSRTSCENAWSSSGWPAALGSAEMAHTSTSHSLWTSRNSGKYRVTSWFAPSVSNRPGGGMVAASLSASFGASLWPTSFSGADTTVTWSRTGLVASVWLRQMTKPPGTSTTAVAATRPRGCQQVSNGLHYQHLNES